MAKITQRIVNKSNYFTVGDKFYFDVPDNKSWRYTSNRMKSYEQRLYYEFDETKKLGGFSIFVTLTYNDNSLPTLHGLPCFNIDDLRSITHGPIFRLVKRKGWRLRYFIACELGDGKGERGLLNNSHYHCAFFCVPRCNVSDYKGEPSSDITAYSLFEMVQRHWQGFTSKERQDYINRFNGRCRLPEHLWYSYSPYGKCDPGCKGVEIVDHTGLYYIAKYVEKSDDKAAFEARIRECVFLDEYKKCLYDDEILFEFADFIGAPYREMFTEDERANYIDLPEFKSFCKDKASDRTDSTMRKLMNKYGYKVRISQGVGSSILEHLSDDGLHVDVPDEKKVSISAPICMYAYRKKYYDHCIDPNTGNTRYWKNSAGLALDDALLDTRIDKHVKNTLQLINVYNHLPKEKQLEHLLPGYITRDIVFRYAVYSIVYKYRFYHVEDVNNDIYNCFRDDYSNFNIPNSSFLGFDPESRKSYYDSLGKDFQLYRTHPFFAPYSDLFDGLDDFRDYVDSFKDDKDKETFHEKRRLKRDFYIYKQSLVL